jgi:aminoglycoside phosphotransferase (APT) family kinase protein
MKMKTSLTRIQSLIDQLSSLHARYWNHSEFGRSLSWLEDHTRGEIHNLFTSSQVKGFVEYQVAAEQFKQEMLERLRVTPSDLFHQFQKVQAHQASLAQTICHGDMHIGNTYILADDHAGLLDWQLTSRGYSMHDISYIIATGLSVADRRTHERDLIQYYRESLLSKGVQNPPSLDELWLEYRRAMVWNVYIGWLITPVINYGRDITVMAHLRMMTAYEDLETLKSLDGL